MRTLNNPNDAETRFASFRDKILAAGATIDDTVLRRIFAQELAGARNWSELLTTLKAAEAQAAPSSALASDLASDLDTAGGSSSDDGATGRYASQTLKEGTVHKLLGYETSPAGQQMQVFVLRQAGGRDIADTFRDDRHPLCDWEVRLRRTADGVFLDFSPITEFPGNDPVFNINLEIRDDALRLYPASDFGDNDAILSLSRAGLLVESTGHTSDFRLYAPNQDPVDCSVLGQLASFTGVPALKAEDPHRAYEFAARAHGYRYEPFITQEITDGIIHGPTFDGDASENETVYTSWAAVCEEMGIEPHRPEFSTHWRHPDGQPRPLKNADGSAVLYSSWQLRLHDNTVPARLIGEVAYDNDTEALFTVRDHGGGRAFLIRRTGKNMDRYFIYDAHDHREIADLMHSVADPCEARGTGIWSDFELLTLFDLPIE